MSFIRSFIYFIFIFIWRFDFKSNSQTTDKLPQVDLRRSAQLKTPNELSYFFPSERRNAIVYVFPSERGSDVVCFFRLRKGRSAVLSQNCSAENVLEVFFFFFRNLFAHPHQKRLKSEKNKNNKKQ